MHGKSVLIVTNTTIAPLYLDKVVKALTQGNPGVTVESAILPDGEKYKNMVGAKHIPLRFWFVHLYSVLSFLSFVYLDCLGIRVGNTNEGL